MADADAEQQQPAARNRTSIAVPVPAHATPLRITKRDIASAGGDTLLTGLQSFKCGSFRIRTTFVTRQPSPPQLSPPPNLPRRRGTSSDQRLDPRGRWDATPLSACS